MSMCAAQSWAAVSELLHANGFRTLAPNQRGYSPGARRFKVFTPDDEAALKDVAGDVIVLAKAENLPAHGEAVRRRFER